MANERLFFAVTNPRPADKQLRRSLYPNGERTRDRNPKTHAYVDAGGMCLECTLALEVHLPDSYFGAQTEDGK